MKFRTAIFACTAVIVLGAFDGCGRDSSPTDPPVKDAADFLIGAWTVDDSSLSGTIRFGADSSYITTSATEDTTGSITYNRAIGKWSASDELIEVTWILSETKIGDSVWVSDDYGGLLDVMLYRIVDSTLLLTRDGKEIGYKRTNE